MAAVAGTHGKTSTSAALAVALRSAGLDVSAVVGGNVPQFPGGRNAVGGGDDVFVVEADEYDGAFLGLEPAVAVLLNVEHDHPDMFKDERAVVAMFARFVRRVRPGGLVVACGDDANVRALVATLAVRDDDFRDAFRDDPRDPRDAEAVSCVTFGFGAANAWRAVDVRADARTGGCSFTVTHRGAFVSEMSVPGTGEYAALNALAAFVAGFEILRRARAERSAATDRLVRSLAESLATHEGVARRMQMIGATERVAVYDDYAHHPTAARLATAAIKERHAGAFLAVAFQPHTRSRTEAMFDAFADALGGEGRRGRARRDAGVRRAPGATGADPGKRGRGERRRGFGPRRAPGGARGRRAFAATEAEAVDAVVDAVRDATTSTKTRPAREDDFHGKKQVVVLCLGAGAGSTSRAGFSRGSTSGIRDRRVGARPSRVARRHVTTPTKRRVRGHAMRASRM